MTLHLDKKNNLKNRLVSGFTGGFTLLEVVIYVVLLSFLLAGSVRYSISVNIRNIDLMQEKGFIAMTAIMLLAMGSLIFALTTLVYASSYGDRVYRQEMRMQTDLYNTTCLDQVSLTLASDFFLNGDVAYKEFSCTAKVINGRSSGFADIYATTTISGIHSYGKRRILFAGENISISP